MFGRRLYLPDINARNKQFQQAAERAAINAPMQGTAADIIKRAMISADLACAARGGARLIMQVHDELVLEVRADRVGEISAAVRGAHDERCVAARALEGRRRHGRQLGPSALTNTGFALRYHASPDPH